MTLFAAALLEKQIVIVCSNLVWFQALSIWHFLSIQFRFLLVWAFGCLFNFIFIY